MIIVSNSILGNELCKISRLKVKMAYDASRSRFFFFAVSSYVSLCIIVDWLFRGIVERPGHRENEHVIEAERGVDRRRRKRPVSATSKTREPTRMQMTSLVSVWAIGCPFFAMKKAIRPPGVADHFRFVFCSYLRLRSASQAIFRARSRRNRANIRKVRLGGPPNQLAHFSLRILSRTNRLTARG